MADQPATRLVVDRVSKAFPGVHALTDVSVEIAAGEIHALVGENGAGKSTLIRIIGGVYRPDSGRVLLDGMPLDGHDERRASALGIGIVHQERSLVSQLSVAENVFATQPPMGRFGTFDRRTARARTAEILAELDAGIDPAAPVGSLSPADQQLVEVAKALSLELKVLVLDEPTAALTLTETARLFAITRRLAARGTSVIWISHRLTEVFELADRVTVLRDGQVQGVSAVSDTTEAELISAMVGRELSHTPDPWRPDPASDIALEVRGLSAPPAVMDASLRVRKGEIVALAGLIGSGRSELCEAIFGARRMHAGEIELAGRPVKIDHPARARELGIGMVPEDRKEAGLFLSMSIADNVVSTNLDVLARRGMLDRRRAREYAEEHVRRLRVVPPDVDRGVLHLSGGNQQKVLLAKWLARRPAVLIVDEPTRGVDVGARADIYEVLRDLARQGTAVIFVSSELPEVLVLAHRIVVMSEGRVSGELDAAGASEEDIMRLASPGESRTRRTA